MITEFSIRNFRCFKAVDAPLRPLTVLIGPNDSGKSTFLDAIRLSFASNPTFSVQDHRRMDEGAEIKLNAFLGKGVGLGLVGTHRGIQQRSPAGATLQAIMAAVHPIALFRLPAGGVALNCNGFSTAEANLLSLEDSGKRTAALLDFILRNDRKRFDSLVANLCELVPGLEDVTCPTPNPHERAVEFKFSNGLTIPGNLVSDGLRICTFFAALAWHPSPPRTILIEEPENGIHPKRLQDIIGLLRTLSVGAVGAHACQVILTTHSPYLLDHVDPSKDQVLIFRRDNDGDRTVDPLDNNKIRHYLDEEFALGEIWANEKEDGMVSEKHQ